MFGQGTAARNTRAMSMKSIKKRWPWGSIIGNRSCNNGIFIISEWQTILSWLPIVNKLNVYKPYDILLEITFSSVVPLSVLCLALSTRVSSVCASTLTACPWSFSTAPVNWPRRRDWSVYCSPPPAISVPGLHTPSQMTGGMWQLSKGEVT